VWSDAPFKGDTNICVAILDEAKVDISIPLPDLRVFPNFLLELWSAIEEADLELFALGPPEVAVSSQKGRLPFSGDQVAARQGDRLCQFGIGRAVGKVRERFRSHVD
jgi:hypothetical protein